MNISLTPELEKFVHDKVAGGRYHSASEVIREGLRLLEEKEQLREVKLAALREEIQKGLDSGPSTPMTSEDWQKIRQEIRQRQAKRDSRTPLSPVS